MARERRSQFAALLQQVAAIGMNLGKVGPQRDGPIVVSRSARAVEPCEPSSRQLVLNVISPIWARYGKSLLQPLSAPASRNITSTYRAGVAIAAVIVVAV